MKRVLLGVVGVVLAAIAVVAFLLAPPAPLAQPEQGALFSDITLIEPGRGRSEHRRLVVRGSHIERIEPASPKRGDPFLGAYAIPGLNDLHVHFPPSAIPGQTELFAFLFLYHGVTGIRDAGDVDGTASAAARDGVARGDFPGPHIVACGPFVDGSPPLWGNSIVVEDAESAVRAVQRIASEGFRCIKAYNELTAPALAAVREAARERGLPVIGHVPKRVPFEVARLDDAQHLIGVAEVQPDEPPFPFNQTKWSNLPPGRVDFVIEQSLTLGIAHTPTLVTTDRIAALRDYPPLLAEPDAQLLPRFYREVLWHPNGGVTPAGHMSPVDFDMMQAALAAKSRTVKQMHDAGVELHTGTDTLVAFIVPGAGLHRELRLLVRAGLTPEQALAISTDASGRALGVPDLGGLRPGARAEIAIFRDDPTRSLDALDSLLGVVRDGRLYTRDMLDAQLARYRAHFERAVYEGILTPLVRRAISRTVPN